MSSSENANTHAATAIQTSIMPWLTFTDCAQAVDFYKQAFHAIETYRLDAPDGGLVVKLSIDGAEFWLSSGNVNGAQEPVGGTTVRLILIIADPFTIFENAIRAGATEVFPIGDDHGWRLGRIVDPFGLHWEIGHPLKS